jgi:hypothetical protein
MLRFWTTVRSDLDVEKTVLITQPLPSRCPGLFFAQSTVWLMCAQSLAAFDISKHVENGAEVTPEFKQMGGTFLSVFDRSFARISLSLTYVLRVIQPSGAL